MDNKINDILYKLQDGKIDFDKASSEIDKIQYDNDTERKARKLKIFINAVDDKEGKNYRINIPGLPFWLLKSFCVPLAKFAVKKSNGKVKGFKIDDAQYVKYIFDALAQMPPFEIVNVDGKDAKVHIYTK